MRNVVRRRLQAAHLRPEIDATVPNPDNPAMAGTDGIIPASLVDDLAHRHISFHGSQAVLHIHPLNPSKTPFYPATMPFSLQDN
jgi:hypothetical protein